MRTERFSTKIWHWQETSLCKLQYILGGFSVTILISIRISDVFWPFSPEKLSFYHSREQEILFLDSGSIFFKSWHCRLEILEDLYIQNIAK